MYVNSRLKAIWIIGQRKAFYRQRIPESSYARKETVSYKWHIKTRLICWWIMLKITYKGLRDQPIYIQGLLIYT